MAKQSPTVQLFYAGAWNDVSSVYSGDASHGSDLLVERGRDGEQSDLTRTRCAAVLEGRDGSMNPRNPSSALYGLVGRGTPLRLFDGTPHVADTNADLADTTSLVAPSVDSPTADALLICVWAVPDPAASFTLPGSMTAGPSTTDSRTTLDSAYESISSSGATGTRTATVSTAEDYVAASVLLHGTSPAVSTTAGFSTVQTSISATQGQWWVVVSYFGWDDVEDTATPDFPSDTDGGGWNLLADSGTFNPGDAQADYFRMKAWAKRVKTTSTHTVWVDNPTDDLDSIQSVFLSIDDVGSYAHRFHGKVTSWRPRRAIKGDAWAEVSAAGPLHRLEQADDPLESVIRRETLGDNNAPYLAAYWPCEDASSATSLASGISGGRSMRIRGTVTVADYTGFGGSEALPTLGSDGNIYAEVTGLSASAAYFRGLFAVPSGGLTDGSSLLGLRCASGTVDRFEVTYGTGGTLNLRALDEDDALLDSTGAISFDVDGAQFLLSVELVQDGSDIDTLVFVRKVTLDGVVEAGSTDADTFTSQTLGPVHRVGVGRGGGLDGLSVGHLMLGTSQQLVFNIGDALAGYAGETAANRFLRICRQRNITAAVAGDPDDSQPMGPQRPDTVLNLLREIELTDDGLIDDGREFDGLRMVTGRSRYNSGASLALDEDADEVAPPLAPDLDDLLTRNEVIAARPDGSSSRAVDQDGPLGVDTIGRAKQQVDVNPQHDLLLANHAGWWLHKGTTQAPRFPRVTVDLDAAPSLADTASAVDGDDRITLDNVDVTVAPPDLVDLLVVGYTETIGTHRRLITYNCVPGLPTVVGVYAAAAETPDPAEPKRYSPTSSTTSASFDAGTDVTLSVTDGTGGNDLWSTAADTPFDVKVDGVRLRVTAVGAAVGADQDLTVDQAAVNGVTKTVAAGAAVELWQPAIRAL